MPRPADVSWSPDLARDARIAVRSYARTPGFTAVALLTFALGIGISTAAFSIIDAILLRPLPYSEPDRIVTVSSQDSLGTPIPTVSAPNFYDWREQNRTLAAMALYETGRRAVLRGEGAVYVEGATVSGDFFRVMRVQPVVGRVLTPADAEQDAPVAVVSHGFWQQALGRSRDLEGVTLQIDNQVHRVVGVLPPGREYPAGVEVIVPSAFDRPWRTASRNNINFRAIARLRDGVSLEQARADLRAIAARLHLAHPEDLYAYGAPVDRLKDQIVRPARSYLELFAGAVAAVLLVACVNLANASLARGSVRSRELAVRTALGAGRARLIRQLLVESVVLALAGGLLGIVLAWALVRAVAVSAAIALPRVGEIGVDLTAFAFALLLSVVVGVIVGLAPALQVGHVSLYASIVAGGRATATRRKLVGRDVLIGAQLTLAIVLLVGAGLLVRSFRAVLSRDLGFDASDGITAELSLPAAKYTDARAAAFITQALPTLSTIPGVAAVGATNALPLASSATGFIEIEGQTDIRAGAGYRVVDVGYFWAMGIALDRGRVFDASDDSGTARVTIVKRRMAERFWPGQDPIGKRFKAKSMEWKNTPWLTVVGVVGDVRHWGLEQEPVPEHYVLYRQRPEFAREMTLIVRGGGPASRVMRAVRERLRLIDREVPLSLRTLESRVHESLAERRFIMTVVAAFGALALALAGVGVYGVLSFTVAQRTREIAVRMAIGAERRSVLALVVGRAFRVSLAAAVVGLLVARALSRVMRAMLFEVRPDDPWTYAVVTLVLVSVALVAAYLPARRAAAVDPMLGVKSV